MTDLGVHIALFLVVAFVIVTISAFYAEPDDAAAFRSLPRRMATFVLGCLALTVAVLLCEVLFAGVR